MLLRLVQFHTLTFSRYLWSFSSWSCFWGWIAGTGILPFGLQWSNKRNLNKPPSQSLKMSWQIMAVWINGTFGFLVSVRHLNQNDVWVENQSSTLWMNLISNSQQLNQQQSDLSSCCGLQRQGSGFWFGPSLTFELFMVWTLNLSSSHIHLTVLD